MWHVDWAHKHSQLALLPLYYSYVRVNVRWLLFYDRQLRSSAETVLSHSLYQCHYLAKAEMKVSKGMFTVEAWS